MKKYYVYAHYRKTDDQIFYVGKGSGYRYKAKHPGNRSKLWSRVANKYGWYVDIVKWFDSEAEALRFECGMIRVFGRVDNGTGILVNHTDGGEGRANRIVSEETRRKLANSEWAKNRPPVSEETRKRMSESRRKRKMPRLSEDTKKKISMTAKARFVKCREEGLPFTPLEIKAAREQTQMNNTS